MKKWAASCAAGCRPRGARPRWRWSPIRPPPARPGAAPDAPRPRGGGVRLYLLGEGWKPAALDAPDDEREEATLEALRAHLARRPLLPEVPVQLQRLAKRAVCEGALRARAAAEP